jgi:hypothetical protein
LLYAKFGFKPLPAPERVMDLNNPDVYAMPDAQASRGA